jgi:hypothetical protein
MNLQVHLVRPDGSGVRRLSDGSLIAPSLPRLEKAL